MEIFLINKKCPNCGANLKFGFSDVSVTCEYCDTHVLIEHQKSNTYKTSSNPNERIIYVNKTTEILKWMSRILIGAMISIFGMAIASFSSPIYGGMLIVAGILAMLPYSLKIFHGHIIKEKIYTWKETYGHIEYYNIKVNNGEYNFRICINPGVGYQFYQREKDWGSRGLHYFYNTKHQNDYVLGEFSH